MRAARALVRFFAILLPVCAAAAIGIHYWEQAGLFYPASETASAFPKTYTPARVVRRFVEEQGYSYADHTSAAAGHKSVSNQRGFEFYVVMRREKWLPLMDALTKDALRQLADTRADILSNSGDPRSGFHFAYRINQSIGSLSISPIVVTSPVVTHRNMALPADMQDVTVRVEEEEQWYPKKVGTVQISFPKSVL